MTKEDLEMLKKDAIFWGNNCGGCETCSQVFGIRELTIDAQDLHELIVMIEERDKEIESLKERLK